MGEDPVGVVHEIIRGLHGHRNRPPLVHLLHHLHLPGRGPVHPAHVSIIRHPPLLHLVQVAGELALLLREVVLPAGLRDQPHVLAPLGNQLRKPAGAPLVVLAAEQGELHGEPLPPGVPLLDPLPRRHHSHRCVDVAAPAPPLVHGVPHEVLPVLVPPVKVRGQGLEPLPHLLRHGRLQEGRALLPGGAAAGAADTAFFVELRPGEVQEVGVDCGGPGGLSTVDLLHVGPVLLQRHPGLRPGLGHRPLHRRSTCDLHALNGCLDHAGGIRFGPYPAPPLVLGGVVVPPDLGLVAPGAVVLDPAVGLHGLVEPAEGEKLRVPQVDFEALVVDHTPPPLLRL
mmetsp:Transcript_21318/g.51646  ORF Transcript_21318/g.51646 Transcript_21318/m.51646 type:complete len:340 (+) Transcript_21318:413-1432(+)